jgi:hypothetical protein
MFCYWPFEGWIAPSLDKAKNQGKVAQPFVDVPE